MKQQSGGTILGFILGVVLGLAVALAVAVYVTKVPVQFMSKGQSRTPDQEAIDSKKNKDWDPNAPLYGKNPAKPIVPAEAAASAAAPGTGAAPAAPVVPKKELKPAVTADPLGDLANSRGASAGNDPFIYFVQVGAYRTPEDAETQRAKLSLGGVETKVSEREQSGRTVFRVRAGPFDKREDADKIKEKLDAAGMETALVRVQR